MNEPQQITAGDSASWTWTLPEYSASAGWALSYVFRANGQPSVTVNATGSGSTYTVALTTTASALMQAGDWHWQAYATKSPDRKTLGSGVLKVKPNFAAGGTFDPRSQVKKTLDAINACIAGTAEREEQELTVDGMALRLRPVSELLTLRSTFSALYSQEVNADRIAEGLGNRNKILVRFTK